MRNELIAWNRGRISPLALARVDFKRTALSADIMTNWMPRKLGSMMLRPGLGYIGATASNLTAVTIPFVAATDDTAFCELTNGLMRVWVDDELVTRAAVTAAIANGTFDTNLTSWTDADGAAATSAWATGGYMSLIGSGSTAAKRRQQVTVNEANTRHALNIVIERGPVLIRVGSSSGDDDYIAETSLETGYHSLAFTPTGASFWVELFAYSKYAALVDSIAVASSGAMTLTAPWTTADLPSIRWDQSADVVFVACDGVRQQRIERRATDSWSVVDYRADDGPFRVLNTGPITLTPAAVDGDTTLTASAAMFKSTHVGALFRLTQTGQTKTASATGADQYTDYIRVVGSDETRGFAISITGTWSGTVTLQYSVAEPGDWIDAPSGSWSANTAQTYDDTLDDQIIYYRLGIKAGDYTSGTAELTISWSNGTQVGICRVTGYTSSTVVNVAVLEDFGTIDATTDWEEGLWSDRRGHPSSVSLYEGRLWWFGLGWVVGSESDAYSDFDDRTVGESGPIIRSIGRGPVDNIYWAAGVDRLVIATAGQIWTARSSSLDEPLTALNFNLKGRSAQGAANIQPVLNDTNIIYVQRGGNRIFEVAYNLAVQASTFDYSVAEVASHIPEIGDPGVIRMAAQVQPEVRIHCVRSDGTVAVLILDRNEEVVCWVDVETDGDVEDVFVLPGTTEDQVYYLVKRTINGSTVRYYERYAREDEAIGGTLCKTLDSYKSGSGSGTTITGLSHLEAETVKVWVDGEYAGTKTVSGGSITQTYTTGYVVGLSYEATFKSTKLLHATQDGGTTLCRRKRINTLGIIARNMHPLALEFGPDFTTMDQMPTTEKYDDVDTSVIWDDYDEDMIPFPGDWNTDSRLCLRATAPYPVTLLAAVMNLDEGS